MTERVPIPAAMKRAVRQRCFFGCVICGSPAYHYEHMTGYTITGHEADDITLLCPQHHHEKTVGRMPVEVVRHANEQPYNRRVSMSPQHPLYFSGSEFSMSLGSSNIRWNLKQTNGYAITVDDEPLIRARFTSGRLRLDLSLFDCDNKPLLNVRDGELRYALDSWDVEFISNRLIVRAGYGEIVLELRFQAPNNISILTGDFWMRGINIRVGRAVGPRGGFEIVNSAIRFDGGTFIGGDSIIDIASTASTSGGFFSGPDPKRYYGGKVPPFGSFRKN